jgi:hypothetical protein
MSTGLWTGGALGPPWTRAGEVVEAHRSRGALALRGAAPRRGGAGRGRGHGGPHRGWRGTAECQRSADNGEGSRQRGKRIRVVFLVLRGGDGNANELLWRWPRCYALL